MESRKTAEENVAPSALSPSEAVGSPGPKPNLFQKYTARVKDEWSQVSQDGIHYVFARLIIPIDVIMVCVFVIAAIWEDIALQLLGLFGLYYITPLGMEIGVAFAIDILHLDPVLTIGFMLWVDMVSAWLLLWNFWFFKIIPFLGFLLAKTERAGHKAIKKYPWIERMEFFGVAIFVMIPLYGTGAIIGTIAGRALDFQPWKIWTAVVLGSGMRLTLLGFYTVWLRSVVPQWMFWLIFALIIVGIFAATTVPDIIRTRRQRQAPSTGPEKGYSASRNPTTKKSED